MLDNLQNTINDMEDENEIESHYYDQGFEEEDDMNGGGIITGGAAN